MQTEHPEWKIILHESNQGKGAALQTGFRAATGDIILVQDADQEYDPNDYPALLAGGILAACAGWARPVGPWVADGYAVVFAVAAVLIAFGWLLCGRVRPDHAHTTRTVFRQLAAMLPWRPFFGSTG